MTLHIITLVLNGEPWIRHHLPQFERLTCPWVWHIMEGVALPVKDTSWIAPQAEALSTDGTHEYLESIKDHPNVRVTSRLLWQGKIEMVNLPFSEGKVSEPGIVLQVDSDECWKTAQLTGIMREFKGRPSLRTMQFKCRYFVGPDIITKGENCYGLNVGEWMRAWRYEKGARFFTHEPPDFAGNRRDVMDRDHTERLGFVFDHYAYATEAQVAFKERIYRYKGAVAGWRRLQENSHWPCRLKDFLPWVDDRATAIKIPA